MDRMTGSRETSIYIIDDDYRICHFNSALQEIFPELQPGDLCYQVLCHEDAPCRNCPLQHSQNESMLFYNRMLKQWLEVCTGRIPWPQKGECNVILCREIHEGNKNLLYNLTDAATYDELYELNLTRNTYRILYHTEHKFMDPEIEGALGDGVERAAREMVHPDDFEAFLKFWDRNTLKERVGESGLCGEYRRRLVDGSWCWAALRVFALKRNRRMDDILMCFVQDINDRKQMEEKLEKRHRKPQINALTGLPDKERFWKEAAEFLLSAREKEYCLVAIDIEHFKLYNEWYGDRAGDRFLKRIGDCLRDAAAGGWLAGYMGEDDFCVILKNDGRMLTLLESRLREFVLQNRSNSGFLPAFGVFEIGDTALPVSTMYDRALIALASAKGNYARRISWYDSQMKEKLEQNHVILSEVQKALERDEITFYLQPKCSMKSGKIIGMEALVRWKHPERGMIPPGEFIGVLEKNGFIPALDQYVWEKVCEKLREWIDRGIRPVPVSVNVSRIDIYTLDIVEIFEDLVCKYALPTELIELEITETAYTEESGLLMDVVNRLRKKGFCVSMDDFGSGASSLNMLKDINVDVLKLDMKFLEMDESSSKRGLGILETIIRMAHLLGIHLIAEGTESREQVEALVGMGCCYGQGYYFYHPMPAEDMERLIADEKNVEYSVGSRDTVENTVGFFKNNAAEFSEKG